MSNIKDAIVLLKMRLHKQNNVLLIQHTNALTFNVGCEFNNPVNHNLFDKIENTSGLILPKDYKEFLKIHNGATLFYDVTSRTEIGTHLLSLEEIIEQDIEENHFDFEKNCIIIGYCNGGTLLIDLDLSQEKTEKKEKYLFWLRDADPLEEIINLNTNFETWLERSIVAQGDEFWEW